ncbi:MAG: methyltransferase domain-containing protein [Deltaproteobacteria bacterium]|nr:methyltransferase domain-containing protein [Deltaproteobacteria bacterium]
MARKEPDERGETLDRICGQIEIFQSRRGYRFGLECPLLAGFASPGAERLVDLGCGSGVLALLLTHFGRAREAVGVEIQPGLAELAARSVRHNRLEGRVRILNADLRCLEGVLPAGGFDRVVANPPHTAAGTGRVDPDGERAAGRHEILCTLPEVVRAAARLLEPLGRFAAIYPPRRLVELLAACSEHGLRPARLRFVHGRIDLAPSSAMLEAVRGGRAELEVEPPLVVYDASGEYTDEVQGFLYPAKPRRGERT